MLTKKQLLLSPLLPLLLDEICEAPTEPLHFHLKSLLKVFPFRDANTNYDMSVLKVLPISHKRASKRKSRFGDEKDQSEEKKKGTWGKAAVSLTEKLPERDRKQKPKEKWQRWGSRK